jgi:hypothetical protein
MSFVCHAYCTYKTHTVYTCLLCREMCVSSFYVNAVDLFLQYVPWIILQCIIKSNLFIVVVPVVAVVVVSVFPHFEIP